MMIFNIRLTFGRALRLQQSWTKPANRALQGQLQVLLRSASFSSVRLGKPYDGIVRARKFKLLRAGADAPELESCVRAEERPLVVLLPWLSAKERHIMKFADLYLQRGADVLVVPGDPFVAMRPSVSTAVAQDIFKVLSGMSSQPIVFHAFSVGCYLYCNFLKGLNSAADEGDAGSRELLGRIRGQIFDSPVDYMHIPPGVAKAVFPSNRMLQKIVTFSLEAYSKLTYKWTTAHYQAVSEWIHSQIPTSSPPILLLYSKVDAVSPLDGVERLQAAWASRGVSFESFGFEDTPHCMHMRLRPDQYTAALAGYVDLFQLRGWQSAEQVKQRQSASG